MDFLFESTSTSTLSACEWSFFMRRRWESSLCHELGLFPFAFAFSFSFPCFVPAPGPPVRNRRVCWLHLFLFLLCYLMSPCFKRRCQFIVGRVMVMELFLMYCISRLSVKSSLDCRLFPVQYPATGVCFLLDADRGAVRLGWGCTVASTWLLRVQVATLSVTRPELPSRIFLS